MQQGTLYLISHSAEFPDKYEITELLRDSVCKKAMPQTHPQPEQELKIFTQRVAVKQETNDSILFTLSKGLKKKYFSTRFELFKRFASEMTLDTFSGIEDKSKNAIYRLQWTIEDTVNDAVLFDNDLCTVQEFMRYAPCNEPLYLSKICYKIL